MGDESVRTREHLANERTFLAWVRTGIALLGAGFLVAKLRLELTPAAVDSPDERMALGLLFALAGLATVVFALIHYSATRRSIDSGTFSPLGKGAVLLVAVVVLVGLVVILDLVGLLPLF